MSDSKLLVLGDSPTTETGFGRVLRNLLPHWVESERFLSIDVWAIGYAGWPSKIPPSWDRLLPAQTYDARNWHDEPNLQRFLEHLHASDYTHLWMLQDSFHICRMAKSLREICRKKNIRSLYYYPVDAPLDELWTEAMSSVDVAVAYCQYGYDEAKEHLPNLKKRILPHGTDLKKYSPLADRPSAKRIFSDAKGRALVRANDFLISAVSMHQRRKGLAQTLQVFRELLERPPTGRQLWLYLHMPPVNSDEGSNLRNLAVQLGIEEHVLFAEAAFVGNVSRMGEDMMQVIYNATDLLLTTTHGEGWGLPITEAMACGTPVAGPVHTAVAGHLNAWAALSQRRGVCLPVHETLVTTTNDMMRMRPVVDVMGAAEAIREAIDGNLLPGMAERALEWVKQPEYRWENIAAEWLKLMFP